MSSPEFLLVDIFRTILELEYSEESDEEARFVTNQIPFRMTRSSKYATGALPEIRQAFTRNVLIVIFISITSFLVAHGLGSSPYFT